MYKRRFNRLYRIRISKNTTATPTATGKIKLTNPLAKIIELYTSTADFLPDGETGGQKFLEPTSENRKFSADFR